MSEEQRDHRANEPLDGEEDLDNLEENDEVIGRAVRRSMLLIGAAAAVAVIVWLARGLLVAAPEDSAIGLDGPVGVEREQSVEPPSVTFTDVTASSGIDFVHQSGAVGDRFLPETMGGGAAFVDYDQDGDQDLVLINSRTWKGAAAGPSRLFENDGSGRFVDRTQGSGLDFVAYATAVAVGDIDNDGFPDLFVSAVGANRMLRNVAAAGSRRFEDVTAAAGVAGEADRWSSSSAFFDADNDGDLDLFVGNYVEWSQDIDIDLDYRLAGVGRAYGQPVNYRGTYPYFYRNQGAGKFVDVSAESGVRVSNIATGEPVAKSLGLAPGDVDGDGLVDLVVANDTVRNFFFQNTGSGFEELGEIVGLAYGRQGEATGAMGIDAGFFRGEQDLGIGIGNFANEMSSFYVSQGSAALFADEAIAVGIGAPSRRVLSFGLFFFDVDLDGRLDLLQSNGHLENEIGKVEPSQSYRQRPQLFWNAGDVARRVFVPIETQGALGQELVGRGSAYADIDQDGDLDVLLLQTGGPAVLLRNDLRGVGEASDNPNFVRFTLEGNGVTANRSAIGAWVTLKSASGVQVRQVMPTKSYQSQSELPLVFGLGTDQGIDSVEVHWPGVARSSAGQQIDVGSLEFNGSTVIRQPPA